MPVKKLYEKSKVLTDKTMHFCPGCTHSLIHKQIAEIIEELDIQNKTMIIAPVGCAVLLYNYINCDTVEAPHGRAPALATGVKRVKPDNVIISYQGDGDLLAIGMAETIHTANRGKNITVIFINNAIYGMTGGQMAPTTIVGQKTMTSPAGRNPANEGYPIGACELLNTLTAPFFIERTKAIDAKSIIKTKNIIKKAIKYQMDKKGYSFVEILSTCPTNWGMTPIDAIKWVEENMSTIYPVKILEIMESRMKYRIILAGFGGQGIIVGGKLLAYAAMKEGKEVTHYPAYGAEMRGGTCNCSVIISDKPISSPVIAEPDIIVVLNKPSKDKYEPMILKDGTMLLNKSLIEEKTKRDDIKSYEVSATEIAEKAGSVKATNMAVLGAFSKITSIISLQSLIDSLKDVFPNINDKLLNININALKEGFDSVK